MKLLLTGDWHLRLSPPRMRKDIYFHTQFNKVQQIFEIAKQEKCHYILQPGDFFDGVDASDFVIQYYIKYLKGQDISILCVRGQHDLRYHSKNVENTPLAIMAAEVAEVEGSP